MTSPAETHAELQRSQRNATRQKRIARQYEGLQAINNGPGFGPCGERALWVEKQIHYHLTAAFNLVQLMYDGTDPA